jgi:hypothetical protein
MTLRAVLGLALLYLLFVIYTTANAYQPIVVKVVAPASPALVDTVVEVFEAILDNQDGTTTFVIRACGTKIMMTVSNADLSGPPDMALIEEFDKQSVGLINRACK